MITLPAEFENRMQALLGREYEALRLCYGKSHVRGARVNSLKCSAEALKKNLPFLLEPSPFSPLSYYVPEDACKAGKLALHHAGAFYSQEPSASSAVTALNPMPGQRVLDLCAAPGGKSSQIAALLEGQGLLWSNEIVKSRANVLLSNLERMGVRNAVVSSCHPETLCSRLAGFFDCVLVDAPCSGEGMFRRDQQAIDDWSPAHVAACAERQSAILESASQAVADHGVLVYSTCTFSVEENEHVIGSFLKKHSEFALEDSGLSCGRPALEKARRIYPMDGGEGHFVARMRRVGEKLCVAGEYVPNGCKAAKEITSFYEELFTVAPFGSLEELGERVLLLPAGLPDLRGLGVLRAGVLLAERTPSGRLEPAHAVFMAARPEELRRCLSFAADSKEAAAFLRGEELDAPADLRGWTGVAVDGITCGFGKCAAGRLKNHYPKGLRCTL